MIIEELHLSSFKGFSHFTLKCSPFTALVGLNNSGKTSILQAIQLLYSIFKFVFGNNDLPDFTNPQWISNPSNQIRRLSFGDPDAIWLHKKTTNPCNISASFSNGYKVLLEITGRNQYKLDIVYEGISIRNYLNDTEHKTAIEEIYQLRPVFVPPISAVSPVEQFIYFNQLQQKLDEGRVGEHWRGNIYWQYNDGSKDSFEETVMMVQRYLPNANILPPKLTHNSPPNFQLEYEENRTTFDIGISGSGLRTLLSLAVVLTASKSKCLLFDEPDAHLHGTLQRAVAHMLMEHATEHNRQIFVTTHAPDFIGEIPVEQIFWIDRAKREGTISDELGLYLVDLGSITQAEAVKAYGSDRILFIEGTLDRSLLKRILGQVSLHDPFEGNVIVATLPNGKGDRTHLSAYQRFLRETLRLEVKIACITDRDYEIDVEATDDITDNASPLVITLKRKEIENYFLDSTVIEAAVRDSADKRQLSTKKKVEVPTVMQIDAQLQDILNDPKIRDDVRHQIVPRFRKTLLTSLDDSTKDREAEKWFYENWNKREWQVTYCSGKAVLRSLRQWLQDNYSLTITNQQLIQAFNSTPNELLKVGDTLRKFFDTHP